MLFFEQTPNSVAKESILQQTGCLHYGRHDIFTFFPEYGSTAILLQKNNKKGNPNGIAFKSTDVIISSALQME